MEPGAAPQQRLKDIPTISDPITPAAWNAHLSRMSLVFAMTGLADNAQQATMRKTLLFLSLGAHGAQRVAHLSPELRQAAAGQPEETYQHYQQVLTAVFSPATESDMAKSDFKRRKQGKREPIQTFHNAKLRLFLEAYRLQIHQLDQNRMENFLDEWLDAICHERVKHDVLDHKPYDNPEGLLNRAMQSTAKYRALLPPSAPAASYIGLYSTNQPGAETGGEVGAANAVRNGGGAGGAEPMELGAVEESDDQEAMLAAMDYAEEQPEKDYWEDFNTQSYTVANALDADNGRDNRACFACGEVGHIKRDCWRRPKNQAQAARNRVRGWGSEPRGRMAPTPPATAAWRPRGGAWRPRGGAGRGWGAAAGPGRVGDRQGSNYRRTAELVQAEMARGGRGPRNNYLNALRQIQEEAAQVNSFPQQTEEVIRQQLDEPGNHQEDGNYTQYQSNF
jgi:hypothetical protein